MYKIKKKKYLLSLILVFLIGIGSCIGFEYLYLGKLQGYIFIKDSKLNDEKDFISKYRTLYEIDKCIDENYLWDYDRDKIQQKLYKEIVASLGDKFSTYMTKSEFKEWNDSLSDSFSGIGLVFEQVDKKFVVVSTVDGSPARKAGLKEKDIILDVDGKTYSDKNDLQNAIKGDNGTKVTIGYERNGKTNKVTLVRESISRDTVLAKVIDNNIGYIRISDFAEKTSEQFQRELKNMEDKKVKGLVIDLRENGGGYLYESVKIADMLLPSCNIVSVVDKNGKSEKFNSEGSCTKLKYTMLVDANTASASEILVGAVQDNKAGSVIGTKTYGKGIVQSTYTLEDESALKLTTMEYLTPKGNHVQGKGIIPDYKVELKKGDKKDYQLEKALDILKK